MRTWKEAKSLEYPAYHHHLVAAQDDILLSIEDGKPIPTKAINALPPWRAVMLCRVADKAGARLQHGTLEELIAMAREVGGDGYLTWPPPYIPTEEER
jgi:hypothetical protein